VVEGLPGGEDAGGVSGPSDHVLRNRVAWDRLAPDYAGPGLRNWAAREPGWGGVGKVPEAQLGVLPPGRRGPTAWSWAAAPGISQRGWPAAGHGRIIRLDRHLRKLGEAR
jgi:hypothetical protein